jgi:hypothetical protein
MQAAGKRTAGALQSMEMPARLAWSVDLLLRRFEFAFDRSTPHMHNVDAPTNCRPHHSAQRQAQFIPAACWALCLQPSFSYPRRLRAGVVERVRRHFDASKLNVKLVENAVKCARRVHDVRQI